MNVEFCVEGTDDLWQTAKNLLRPALSFEHPLIFFIPRTFQGCRAYYYIFLSLLDGTSNDPLHKKSLGRDVEEYDRNDADDCGEDQSVK